MTFKPVGIDEDSKFPQRVEDRLAGLFAPKSSNSPSYVGLGNVDNTKDADKPVSGPTQTALDSKAPIASPAFTGTPTGITKGHVGLGNVDNTSDANKPLAQGAKTRVIKTATQGPFGAGSANQGIVANVPTFTFKAGRKYALHFSFEYMGTVADDLVSVDISTCLVADSPTAITGLTKIGGSSLPVVVASSGVHGDVWAYVDPTSDTTVQIKASAFVWTGAGNVSIQAASTNPAVLTIFDQGAQF